LPSCRTSLEAALMMGTPANKAILADAGLLSWKERTRRQRSGPRRPRGRAQAAQAALAAAEARCSSRDAHAAGAGSAAPPRTLRGALRALPAQPGADLRARRLRRGEARAALRAGLDVMIFSDNVPLTRKSR
jgi:FdrA protein